MNSKIVKSMRHAKKLSLIKWKFLKEFRYTDMSTGGSALKALKKAHPELAKIRDTCGFCEYIDDGCNSCPLHETLSGSCCSGRYGSWANNVSRKTAKAVYDYIEKVKT